MSSFSIFLSFCRTFAPKSKLNYLLSLTNLWLEIFDNQYFGFLKPDRHWNVPKIRYINKNLATGYESKITT